jgi:hypothetical protein
LIPDPSSSSPRHAQSLAHLGGKVTRGNQLRDRLEKDVGVVHPVRSPVAMSRLRSGLLLFLGSPKSHVGSPRRVPSTGTSQGEAFNSRWSFNLGTRSIAIGRLCRMMTRLQTGRQELASATLVYGERLSDERELETDHSFSFSHALCRSSRAGKTSDVHGILEGDLTMNCTNKTAVGSTRRPTPVHCILRFGPRPVYHRIRPTGSSITPKLNRPAQDVER